MHWIGSSDNCDANEADVVIIPAAAHQVATSHRHVCAPAIVCLLENATCSSLNEPLVLFVARNPWD